MLFSVIIPVYNTATYLAKCLDSVIGQTFDDYEVICVDDGSTDNSHEIIDRYAPRIKHFKSIRQPNKGIGSARNAGLQVAEGEYVLFLDSDDWIAAETLETLDREMGDADMVCFNGRRYFDDQQRYEEPDPLCREEGLSGWQYYCRHALEPRRFAFVCVVLRCYRRSLLTDNALYFKEGIYHEDNLFTPIVCYYAQRVKIIDQVLYIYRVRAHSVMTSRSITHWRNLIETANELADFFLSKQGIDKTVAYRSITHHYQMAFVAGNRHDDKSLLQTIHWSSYHTVSRTKLRHRIQYRLIRFHPSLFRLLQTRFKN